MAPKDNELTLLLNESQDSKEARRFVEESGHPYRAIPASGESFQVPAVKLGDSTYASLDYLKQFVIALAPERFSFRLGRFKKRFPR